MCMVWVSGVSQRRTTAYFCVLLLCTDVQAAPPQLCRLPSARTLSLPSLFPPLSSPAHQPTSQPTPTNPSYLLIDACLFSQEVCHSLAVGGRQGPQEPGVLADLRNGDAVSECGCCSCGWCGCVGVCEGKKAQCKGTCCQRSWECQSREWHGKPTRGARYPPNQACTE